MDKKCIQCGTVFPAERDTAQFCGGACRAKYNRKHSAKRKAKPKPDGHHTNSITKDVIKTAVAPHITKPVRKVPPIRKDSLPEVQKPTAMVLVRRCTRCNKRFKSVEYERLCPECRKNETVSYTPGDVVAKPLTYKPGTMGAWLANIQDTMPKSRDIDKQPDSSAYTDI